MKRPIAIDLFAGAGGLSLGLEQAGFDVVAAIEIDPVHAAVHKFNFPLCAVLPRSVKELSATEIRHVADLGDRRIDLVAGGAPCQGFSLIGQRALDDPRNSLVRDFVRLVVELDASYFIFENVKGLTVGKHKSFLAEIIQEFERSGYRVQMPWQVLDASNYGVPQRRERLFLLGAKRGFPLPKYPAPKTTPADSCQRTFGLPYGPSCKDAIGDIPNSDKFAALIESDAVMTDQWGMPSPYASELRCMRPKDWYFGYRRKSEPKLLTSSMRTYHTEISRRRFSGTEHGAVEPISRFFKLNPGGLSNTLRAGTDSARGAFTSPRPIHYRYPRCITVREMARLHGFPDWFRFHETKWHGARQIGNSVPPPLARSIAEEIMAALGVKPIRPARVLDLGNGELLRMGMSEAAEYWNVPVAIGRRDRKSGIKKRKQETIEQERRLAGAK